MNLILLLVLVLQVCIGICAWLSPEWLRSVAARLLTRADLIDIVRKEGQRRMQFWTAELGLTEHSGEQVGAAVPQARIVGRQRIA
jgi:hypothetical protein